MRDDGSNGWMVVHSSPDGRERGASDQQGAGWLVTLVGAEPAVGPATQL